MVANLNLPEGPSLGEDFDPKLPNTPKAMLELQQRSTMDMLAMGAADYASNWFGIPHAIVNMADVFASSLIPGIGKDDLTNYLKEHGGEFGRFYGEHRQGLEAASGLASMWVPGMFAAKLMRSGGFIANAAKATLGEDAAAFITSTGLSNTERFESMYQSARVMGANPMVTSLTRDPTWMAKRAAGVRRAAGDAVIESAAFEAGVALTMHNNDFLFPEELSVGDSLAWGAANVAIGGTLGTVIARRMLVRGSQQAFDEARALSTLPSQTAASVAQGNIKDARGVALSANALLHQDATTANIAASSAQDAGAGEAAIAMMNATGARMSDIIRDVFHDSPVPGITQAVEMGDEALSPWLSTIQAGLKNEPTMATGVRSFDPVVDYTMPSQYVAARQGKITEAATQIENTQRELETLAKMRQTSSVADKTQRLTNKLTKLQAEHDDLVRSVPVFHEIDGTISVPATRAPVWQDGSRRIGTVGFGNSQIRFGSLELTANKDGQVIIRDTAKAKGDLSDLDLKDFDAGQTEKLPDGAKLLDADAWRSMSHMERTAVQDLLQHQAERTNPTMIKEPITVSDRMHHTQLDYLLKWQSHWGDQAEGRLAGVGSLDELEHATARSKFFDYQYIRNQAGVGNEEHLIYRNSDNVARALNLPTDRHPLLMFFESQRQADGPLVDLSLLAPTKAELQRGVRSQFGPVEPIANDAIKPFSMDGGRLSLPRDRRPVMSLIRNLVDNRTVNAADLQRMAAQQSMEMVEGFRNDTSAIIINRQLDVLQQQQPVVDAFKQDLHSITEGNAIDGVLLRQIYQQPFKYRELPAYQHATRLQDLMDKALDKHIEEILHTPTPWGRMLDADKGITQSHQEIFSELTGKGNEYDMDMFHAFRHARGAGWEVADNAIVPSQIASPTGEPLYTIALDGKSRKNRDIYKAMFGTDMPDNAMMPMTGRQQPVVLTEKSKNAAMSMDALSQQILTEHNSIMRRMGLPETRRVNLHMPALDLTAVSRKYVADDTGKVLFVVGGQTERAAAELARKEVDTARTMGRDLRVLNESDLERYKYSNAESWMEMSDYSRPSNQTGTARGTSFGGQIRLGNEEFHRMLEGQLRQLSDLGRRTRALVFQPQLSYLGIQKAASGVEGKTVFDDVASALTGTQNLDAESFVGKGLRAAETLYDKFLQNLHDEMLPNMPSLGFKKRVEKRLGQAQSRIPIQFQPFKSLDDYMSSTVTERSVGTLRKHAAALNEVTAAVSIRMFDIGMSMVNFMSLASTMPAVTAALNRRAGEAEAAWMKRIGAYGTVTPGGNHYFSPAKILSYAADMRFSDEGKAILVDAAKRGLLAQAAAEQIELYSRTGESFLPGVLRKFSNKASKLTDWSERESRAIPFLAFYKIGKDGLGLQHDAAMLFAHTHANNTIADFRPMARPAIFQGAAGMPLGLFTTYMWNHTQRMVDMLENVGVAGGKFFQKPLAVQLGTQGALFGASSLPGWDLYVDHFGANHDKSHNIVDRLNESMGHGAAEVFLTGSVSNLPKLFGLEGINFSSRASMGLPFQYGSGLQGAAGIRFVTRVADMMGKMADSIASEHGPDPTRLAEIYAQANINKFTSNIAELATGHALDSTGNVIEKDTRTASSVAARLLFGAKPLFADEARKENARNRTTDRIRGELMDELGQKLRAGFRNGKVRGEFVEQALTEYVKAGGSPQYFARYMQSQLLLGTQDKTSREIAKALKKSIDDGRVGRLLYYQRD